MVYCGPANPGDPTLAEYRAAIQMAAAFDDLDDPEYEWARQQMALVGVVFPAVRMRPDPLISQLIEC